MIDWKEQKISIVWIFHQNKYQIGKSNNQVLKNSNYSQA